MGGPEAEPGQPPLGVDVVEEVGARLGRLEARIALPLVFAKLSGPALDGGPVYRPSTVSRGPAPLPVTFEHVG
ncbi:cytochrome P450 [Streptomyces sp. NK08204]|uniref:cytochrome P450 n=1 Tax=Streptomyces sp. NK08204 TaxID=2873260 RepID=UPI001CEC990C|nr:cytochrome P450 [Streptomyces sp. NK08204]